MACVNREVLSSSRGRPLTSGASPRMPGMPWKSSASPRMPGMPWKSGASPRMPGLPWKSGTSPRMPGIPWKSGASAPRNSALGKWGFSPCHAARLLLLLFAILLSAIPLHARSWRITNFHDTITVHRDGSAIVNESITLKFDGEFHGFHRTIPIEYPGPNGTNYQLFIKILSITSDDGSNLKYDSSTSGAFRDLKIYLPNASNTTRTVQIAYRVRNGTRFFDQYDEFYWNVTGNDWPVPIDQAQATVQFPDTAGDALRAQAFTGVYGSTERNASAQVAGSTASFQTTGPLPMRGGLTLDVYIPKGVLDAPSAFTKLIWFLGGNAVVFLPLVTLLAMFTLWWTVGRDPDPGVSVAPMYEPPKGISPAEAGTLLDDSIHPRDITSTIVDLAVRGFIKIEETDEKGLLFHHKDYVFHLLKPESEWSDLQPHERVMLANFFLAGEGTRLSDLRNRFYTAVPVIRQDIMSALKTKGVYALDPD